jgi:hypothetical protein
MDDRHLPGLLDKCKLLSCQKLCNGGWRILIRGKDAQIAFVALGVVRNEISGSWTLLSKEGDWEERQLHRQNDHGRGRLRRIQ